MRIAYARHFLVLCTMSVALAVSSRWQVVPDAQLEFALYGALYAAALAVCHRGPYSLATQLLFIAASGLLCALTARLGLSLVRFAGALPPLAGPAVLLTLCSAAGAAAYAALVQTVGLYHFTPASLVATVFVCSAATLAAFIVASRVHVLGSLWVTIPWWFAFSGSLWYHARLPASEAPRPLRHDRK